MVSEHQPVSTMGSISKNMFEESRKGLEESYAALAKLFERNSTNRRGPNDGMSGIVVNVKQLQRLCDAALASIVA